MVLDAERSYGSLAHWLDAYRDAFDGLAGTARGGAGPLARGQAPRPITNLRSPIRTRDCEGERSVRLHSFVRPNVRAHRRGPIADN
jgi:hypothetical protein